MSLTFCSLASGSSGNCQLVGTENTKILVDAGMTGKYIKESLQNIGVSMDEINGILLTHEHSDHISSLGVLLRRYKIPLYVSSKTWTKVATKVGNYDEALIHVLDIMDSFEIGDIQIKSIPVKHDAVDPRCYTFRKEKYEIGIATDLGTVSQEIIDAFSTCDLLMLESNHDEMMLKTGRYPFQLKQRVLSEYGHLSNEDAGYIAKELMGYGHIKHIILGHLSKENNFPDLAYETVKSVLMLEGYVVDRDVQLDLTYRDRVGKLYQFVR